MRINFDDNMIMQNTSVTTTTSEYSISGAHETLSPEPDIGIQVKGLVKTFKVHKINVK